MEFCFSDVIRIMVSVNLYFQYITHVFVRLFFFLLFFLGLVYGVGSSF